MAELMRLRLPDITEAVSGLLASMLLRRMGSLVYPPVLPWNLHAMKLRLCTDMDHLLSLFYQYFSCFFVYVLGFTKNTLSLKAILSKVFFSESSLGL